MSERIRNAEQAISAALAELIYEYTIEDDKEQQARLYSAASILNDATYALQAARRRSGRPLPLLLTASED